MQSDHRRACQPAYFQGAMPGSETDLSRNERSVARRSWPGRGRALRLSPSSQRRLGLVRQRARQARQAGGKTIGLAERLRAAQDALRESVG
ncbi:hypothetical protein SAMN02787144_102889 [Streptomyces atratus]|uniref:Uncharacterized protein n=1 Tax=Streptomyces atratus TaxID=1893 RepID=A0A1K2F3V7_STRAR|nr:hypothetical protein SAMN02787144_102889 [Streptomyces atratus]